MTMIAYAFLPISAPQARTKQDAATRRVRAAAQGESRRRLENEERFSEMATDTQKRHGGRTDQALVWQI